MPCHMFFIWHIFCIYYIAEVDIVKKALKNRMVNVQSELTITLSNCEITLHELFHSVILDIYIQEHKQYPIIVLFNRRGAAPVVRTVMEWLAHAEICLAGVVRPGGTGGVR